MNKQTRGILLWSDNENRKHLGDNLKLIEAGELVPLYDRTTSHWGAHACFLDKECMAYGAPKRLALYNRWWRLSISFTKGSRFAGMPKRKFRREPGFNLGGWVVLEPTLENTCRNVVAVTYEVEGSQRWITSVRTCPSKKNHKGPCYDYFKETLVVKPAIEEGPVKERAPLPFEL